MGVRAVEFFSGVGGWRYALGTLGEVVAAYDISPHANRVYSHNHGESPREREIASLPLEEVEAHGTDLWLMSPPCQPTCRMGNGLDLEDARSRAFIHLMGAMRTLRPSAVVLENVAGFLGSGSHRLFLESAGASGLQVTSFLGCPTGMGIPNQRPRLYLLASRRAAVLPPLPDSTPRPLSDFLDEGEDPGLYLPPEVLARHRGGMDLVEPADRRSSCFIGGYGQKFVGGGSFLSTSLGIRRFAPTEIAALLGFPGRFSFPAETPRSSRYKLLGNSLSVTMASWVLDAWWGSITH
ncbi:MAG: DNA cytosine methyltransferase [Acidobacteria bacterium]|nr:DNA cytosine methyltransferase [Acidobacteriota bacterium]